MLNISNLTSRMGGRVLIEKASVAVQDGWRVGLIGLNGTGKSTLFKLITRELEPDDGEITISARHRLGIVRQDMPESDEPLLDIVLQADTERAALLAESETDMDPYRVAEVHARLQEIDAYTAPARASAILAGLGFNEAQITGPFSALSGGWRMRVALAAVLFTQPELLLLDEPTNHLDLEAIIWLEAYLSTYPHTLVIISHDRELLNTCVDHIVHLHDRSLTMYTGNYDTFERERALKLDLQQKLHEKQTAQRAHIQKFIDRFKAKASKARQAQSRVKMLEKMDVVDAVIAARSLSFTFPNPDKLPPPIISLDKANIGYESKVVLRQVDERIDTDDRIALLGANGNGKSTLIKLIAGKLKPLQGEMVRNGKLKIGYFSQHQTDELDMSTTPFLAMQRMCVNFKVDSREPIVRARLGQFGFSKELSDNKISTLSGGEKARLLFAFMSFDAPHILLLDEPTNHLDIDARSALIDALNAYEGAVVIVSHDPSMLERVADRLWLVHDGGVKDFDGDLADYRKFVMDQRRASRRSDKAKKGGDDKAAARQNAAEIRKALAPLMNTAKEAEKEVERLSKEKARLESMMGDAKFYDNPANVIKTQLSYGHVSKQLEKSEQHWLDAVNEYEKAKAAAEAA